MSLALSSDPGDGAALSPGPLVNMRQLAAYLRTSRQTLSVWLDRWADFPVVERGTNGREYRFDVRAVSTFLRAKRDEQARSTAERDQALSQLAFPFDPPPDEPPEPRLSLKDQVEALKLRRLQREEAERSGRLVEAAGVADLLTTCLTTLQRTLRAGIRQAGLEHNLPDPVIRALEARLADAQRAFVRDAGAFLQPGASTSD